MRITSKRQMYRMLKRGDFGNTVRHWESYREMVADPYRGSVGVRLHEVGKSWRLYHVSKDTMIQQIEMRGWEDRPGLEFYESPPDEFRTIQGEITRAPWGLYFRYTLAQGAMRLALEEQELHASGAEVGVLLDRYVDPGSRDWIGELLDKHDGCVVEFTSYRIPVGTLQTPTLIWEVRHY